MYLTGVLLFLSSSANLNWRSLSGRYVWNCFQPKFLEKEEKFKYNKLHSQVASNPDFLGETCHCRCCRRFSWDMEPKKKHLKEKSFFHTSMLYVSCEFSGVFIGSCLLEIPMIHRIPVDFYIHYRSHGSYGNQTNCWCSSRLLFDKTPRHPKISQAPPEAKEHPPVNEFTKKILYAWMSSGIGGHEILFIVS